MCTLWQSHRFPQAHFVSKKYKLPMSGVFLRIPERKQKFPYRRPYKVLHISYKRQHCIRQKIRIQAHIQKTKKKEREKRSKGWKARREIEAERGRGREKWKKRERVNTEYHNGLCENMGEHKDKSYIYAHIYGIRCELPRLPLFDYRQCLSLYVALRTPPSVYSPASSRAPRC